MKRIITLIFALFAFIGISKADGIGYATNVYPEDMATNIGVESVNLQWELDENTTEWRLVFGTTYYLDQAHPQTIVTEWTEELSNSYEVNDLLHNTNYFWRIDQRNDSVMLEGIIWGFTTTLNTPVNLNVNETNAFNGGSVTLTWEPVVDRTFRTYYVYRNGEKIGETIANNIDVCEYVDEGLEYNMNGYQYYVTVIYDEGESEPSNIVTVYVSGIAQINGYVYETDGETGIENVTITMNGENEFGENQEYTFTTDENGYYEGEVYAGEYNGIAEFDGYITSESPINGNPFSVVYPLTENVNYILVEELHNPCEVIAYFMEENNDYVKVDWDMCEYGEGVHHYKVYRTDCSNEGPYTEENTLLLADSYEQVSTYVDVNWSYATVGEYKWGVAAVYEGREFAEPFESEIVWSNCLEKEYVNPCPPGAPIHLTNEPNNTQVVLSWEQSIEVVKYNVYRNDELVEEIEYDPDVEVYEYTDEPGFGEWIYQVKVVNVNTECDEVASFDYDNPENDFVIAEVACEGVTELYAGVDNETDYVNLVWNAIEAEHIIIERSEDGDNFEQIAEIDGSSTGWYDENVGIGDYYYRVIVDHGTCQSEPSNIVQVYVTSVEEITNANIYPNPVDNLLTIEVEGEKNISIYNSIGQNIYNSTTCDNIVKIDMSSYNNGVYFVNINGITYKIVK